MLFLRKFFAGIFFLLVTSVFLPFFITFLLLQTYLSPSFVSQTLLPSSYDKLGLVFESSEGSFGDLKPKDAEAMFKKFIPRERYLTLSRSLLEESVASVKVFMPGEPLKLSFLETKKLIFHEIQSYAASLPICTPGQKPEKDFCIPSGHTLQEQQYLRDQFAKELIRQVNESIPGSFSLKEPESLPWIQYLSLLFKYHSQMVWGMGGALFVLLALMGLILWKPLRLVLRWEAHFFLLSALQPFGLYYLLTQMPGYIKKVGPVKPAILDLVQWFFSFLQPWFLYSGVLLGVFAVLLYGGALAARPKK